MASRSSPSSQSDTSHDRHDQDVRRAVVALVCDQAGRGIWTNLGVWVLLLFGLAGEVASTARWLIFALAAIFSVPRLAVVYGYRFRAQRFRVSSWEVLFNLTLVLSTLVWGGATLYLMPQLSPRLQLLLYAFVLGMAGGTAIVYNAQKLAAILGVIFLLSPAILWMLIEGDTVGRVAGGAGLFMIAMTIRSVPLQSALVFRYYDLVQEIDAERAQAEKLARTDQLTGLDNRRAFREKASRAISRARRGGDSLTLVLLDLDRFKQVNDRFGHAAGDVTLRRFAEELRGAARHEDSVGRLGGDEFAVLLAGVRAEQTDAFASRVRQRLADLEIPEIAPERVLFSHGAAELRDDESLDQLQARADRALYRSKSQVPPEDR